MALTVTPCSRSVTTPPGAGDALPGAAPATAAGAGPAIAPGATAGAPPTADPLAEAAAAAFAVLGGTVVGEGAVAVPEATVGVGTDPTGAPGAVLACATSCDCSWCTSVFSSSTSRLR